MSAIVCLHTHLFVFPHQVGLGVAGVMDHHLLLSSAAPNSATRGAEEAVVMEEYYGEKGAQDVKGSSGVEEESKN